MAIKCTKIYVKQRFIVYRTVDNNVRLVSFVQILFRPLSFNYFVIRCDYKSLYICVSAV